MVALFWLDNGSGGAGSIPAKTTGRVNVTTLKPLFPTFRGLRVLNRFPVCVERSYSNFPWLWLRALLRKRNGLPRAATRNRPSIPTVPKKGFTNDYSTDGEAGR